MTRIWTNGFALVLALAALAGCAAPPQKILPHDDTAMLDVWNQNTGGGIGGSRAARQLMDARQVLRRPLVAADGVTVKQANSAYTRTAANEIQSQFKRLPNPDLTMYVFPHLAGTDPTPVPGYTTIFPFYERVQYAMPGERTEDY